MATWKARSGCMFTVIKMELSGKTVYGPVLKTSPERCRKSFTMNFLGVIGDNCERAYEFYASN